MAADSPSGARPRRSSLIALLVTAAVLYLAKDVLVPLALAILLSFVMAPAVRRLERWKLGRLPATLAVAILAFGIIAAVGAVAGTQAVSLAAKLPEYRHNIITKIHKLRHPDRTSTIGKAAQAIKDIEKEAAPDRPPVPVKETPATSFEALAQFAAPVLKPFAMTLAVMVFTVLLLLNRENMRDRLIGLVGAGRLNATTKAMAEASDRVTRYLGTQFVVNAMFGLSFGMALAVIGIPNAVLFGLLGMVLRFIPYIGVWIAAAMPAALAFAISDGWSPVLWTASVFFALEALLAYVVEPWLYGKSAGLSPIAIIAAVIFWTWLWGPVGLLLATPLTVCVAVMGRHLPELGYLNVLLGVEPVLSEEQRFYQRLIALDHEEAEEMIERRVTAQGMVSTFDEVLVPALTLAKNERRKGALEPTRERFVYEHMRRMIEELEQEPASAPRGAAPLPVCLVPAHDEPDHIAALMLAKLLPQAAVIAPPALANEVLQMVAQRRCAAILISAVPPHSAHYAGYLARRLRRQLPDMKIVVGLWSGENIEAARARLVKLGVNDVLPRLAQAADVLRQVGEGGRGGANTAANEEAKHSARR